MIAPKAQYRCGADRPSTWIIFMDAGRERELRLEAIWSSSFMWPGLRCRMLYGKRKTESGPYVCPLSVGHPINGMCRCPTDNGYRWNRSLGRLKVKLVPTPTQPQSSWNNDVVVNL